MFFVAALLLLFATVQADDPCPSGFDQEVYGGKCYFYSGSLKKTKSQAEAACEALDAELVSVETTGEFDYLQPKLQAASTGSHWSSGVRVTNGFYWATGDWIPGSLATWAGGEPNNAGNNEGCVELRVGFQYKLNDMPCNYKLSFSCETPAEAGECPNDFELNGDTCYYFHGATDHSWDEANTACIAKGAALVTPVDDYDYVKSKIDGTNKSFWTSGRRAKFLWGSGPPLPNGFTKWNSGEPNNGNEKCINFRAAVRYELNDAYCTKQFSYVCERRSMCPGGFISRNSDCSCYKFPDKNTKQNYNDAVRTCESFADRTSLVSYQTGEELDFVKAYLTSIGETRNYWTSARRQDNTFHWGTGEKTADNFSGWRSGEPNDAGGREDCVELRKGFGFDMNDMPCDQKLSFICELPFDTCLSSCVKNADFGSCYYFHDAGTSTWPDARSFCYVMGGDLVSLETEAEFDWIKSQAAGSPTSFWTSGYRTVFMWTTGDALPGDFSKWNTGEPNDSGSTEDCVEVYASGVMNDNTCSKSRSIVCEKRGYC